MTNEELTIQLTGKEDGLPVSSFVSVLQDAVDMLRHIEASVSDTHTSSLRWKLLDASHNSPLQFVLGAPKDRRHVRDATIDYFLAGLQQIEEGTTEVPDHFRVATLVKAKHLVSVLNDGIADIKIGSQHRGVIRVTLHVAATVDKLMPTRHDEIGSIVGKMETITVHDKKLFAVWDEVTGLRVECHVGSDLIDAASSAFRKRVNVSGRIQYNEFNKPVKLTVTGIEVYPDQADLPQMKDLQALFQGWTVGSLPNGR